MKKVILEISGMSCDHCVKHVKESLDGLSGVVAADVTLSPGKAEVFAGEELNNAVLIGAVDEAGYSAKVLSEESE